jgi:hypothetical protein
VSFQNRLESGRAGQLAKIDKALGLLIFSVIVYIHQVEILIEVGQPPAFSGELEITGIIMSMVGPHNVVRGPTKPAAGRPGRR